MFPSHDLYGVDTSMCLDAVGALVIIVALEFVASVAAEFHSKHSPSTIKQMALDRDWETLSIFWHRDNSW